jgi:hypothetical protein
VVAECRDILAVIKHEAKKSDMERFNLRKTSEIRFRKQYQIKISNRFADLQNLNNSAEINRIL